MRVVLDAVGVLAGGGCRLRLRWDVMTEAILLMVGLLLLPWGSEALQLHIRVHQVACDARGTCKECRGGCDRHSIYMKIYVNARLRLDLCFPLLPRETFRVDARVDDNFLAELLWNGLYTGPQAVR